ncbi:MAG TPA: DNA-processing protein DprA [Patescibacteria group bacterium]
MSEDFYYLGFSVFPGIGPANFNKLLEYFGTAQKAWKAEHSDLTQVLGEVLGQKFIDFRKNFSLEKYAEDLAKKDIHYVCFFNKNYPKLLSIIPKAPFILYYKGNDSLLQKDKTIGIVGTRKVTDYGRQVTEMLTSNLVMNDFVIISGLALGVDGIAHKEALKNKGNTIAVLGSGVDRPTPREHINLYNEILEGGGLIVSTFVPGEDASKGSFPARNGTIAGLSQGILVTEGASDSGSLITAEYARKFNRPLFAVPGPITSDVSKGTNNLIKNGAIPVSDSGEILDRLGIMGTQVKIQNAKVKNLKGDTVEEKEVLDMLQNGALHFDDIVRKMEKDSKTVGSILSLMELKGFVRILSDGKYEIS